MLNWNCDNRWSRTSFSYSSEFACKFLSSHTFWKRSFTTPYCSSCFHFRSCPLILRYIISIYLKTRRHCCRETTSRLNELLLGDLRTNRERVILPSSRSKIKKNTLFIDQSAFSNFARYLIIHVKAKSERFTAASSRCRVRTLNMKISRRRLAENVKTLQQKACRTCSTIIFLHSTNQIIDLRRCRWRCRRQILNSLVVMLQLVATIFTRLAQDLSKGKLLESYIKLLRDNEQYQKQRLCNKRLPAELQDSQQKEPKGAIHPFTPLFELPTWSSLVLQLLVPTMAPKQLGFHCRTISAQLYLIQPLTV